MSPNADPTLSSLFCDPNADITFKSSDNTLFKIHSKYLKATSGGFTPPPSVTMDQEVVLLEEPSEILEILFGFIHPPTEAQQCRQPTMTGVQPNILFAVAEAAEKYIVFAAMSVCSLRMDKIAAQHPLEILNHSFKHGIDELADQVAPLTITFQGRLSEVAAKLTYPGLLHKWLVYYDCWIEIPRFTRDFIKKARYKNCPRVVVWEIAFLNKFADHPLCVFSPPAVPSTPECSYQCGCNKGTNVLMHLFSELAKEGRAIPKFTSIQIPSC